MNKEGGIVASISWIYHPNIDGWNDNNNIVQMALEQIQKQHIFLEHLEVQYFGILQDPDFAWHWIILHIHIQT